MTPAEVVQKQLEAYNAHDLAAFAATYSPNIRIYDFPGNTVILEGLEALQERYSQRLATPGLRAAIASRTVLGRFVVDLEHVTSEQQLAIHKVVAIYEVVDDKIQQVWFVRE